MLISDREIGLAQRGYDPDRRAGIGPYCRAANLPTLKKGAGFGPTP
jgi:hypothetical protein